MNKLRVAVLMGGTSSERAVSLMSGARVVAALDRAQYDVRPVDFTGDVAQISALKADTDVVFLALHGPGGEDGRIQGVLDLLGLPYTGSGVLGSALAMHKGVAKAIYCQANIPTPRGITLRMSPTTSPGASAERVRATLGLPCVVKPANEGSTFGVSIVREIEQLEPALTMAAGFDAEVIVEQFIAGTEITVPVLGTTRPRALPVIEIIPASGFYDFEMKYTPGATQEVCPARLSDDVTARAMDYAVRAHQALCCRGVSRTDMIVAGEVIMVLETNTLPGMTDTSLLPLSARVAGIAFPALLDYLLADALGKDPA